MRQRPNEQEQSGGENSTNLQAGGDLVYIGPSREEVKEIALAVFQQNFLELRGIAEDVALARADKITTEFLTKMYAEAPEAAERFSDPDVQRSVFNAQREYACSGEDDLGQVLVDLLVDRVKEDDRNLRTLALNEAITAAPKLTEAQRRAIALAFLVRYTRVPAILPNAQSVIDVRLRGTMLTLPVPTEPLRDVDFQHIEYVGAGAVSISEVGLGDAIRTSQTSAFTNGFSAEQMPEDLRDSPLRHRLLMPCFRNPENFQLQVPATQDVDDLIKTLGAEHLRSSVVQVQELGVLSGAEVEADLKARAPDVAALFEEWNGTALKNVTLTSVGLALGHAYWRRFGGDAPLSVWL
ncbi:LPO_1073/Vpar_1526 family protein [Nocardioides sp. Arc9.136]|uniref:LPO_1073/Vpar_1526 family protein n=1 Tax=Nocardioides sp. Arc9.136 TaxID=2996826 RepID=UPI0026661879|nr:LPO_1073/Vpar_1526 family protein [Nocardioides sp. Arc9.136]WKN47847.1 hypothetical protein OSR43_17625 [Nocardioides sp. Arc9.136]